MRSKPSTARLGFVALLIIAITLFAVLKLISNSQEKPISDQRLLQRLSSNDMQVRWDAFHHLANHRPIWLAELTLSQDQKLKEQAIRTIRSHQVSAAISQLHEISAQNENPLRAAAVSNAIQEVGPTPWYSESNLP
ncbi:MAG: hypothetical protein JJ974_11440 [Phycisphaerales bacterium]|nr:hypothetical protein [Phycisphaerales bacterium]